MYNLNDSKLIEQIAMTIYCDSYTQYGTCSLHRWQQTSETQRIFFRGQAVAVLQLLNSFVPTSLSEPSR